MSENPFTPENGWVPKPVTLKRSDLLALARVFVTIHGGAKIGAIRDLRFATEKFIPLEDNGIQAVDVDGNPKDRWFLGDLAGAARQAASE